MKRILAMVAATVTLTFFVGCSAKSQPSKPAPRADAEKKAWADCRKLPTVKEQSACERKVWDKFGYNERWRAQQKRMEHQSKLR